MIAEVVLKLPVQESFDYIVPEDLYAKHPTKNLIGYRVIVPFRGNLKTGIVVAMKETSLFQKLKYIHKLADNFALVDSKFIRFARWISEYYLCGWGEIVFLSLPKKIDIRPSKLKAWSNPLDKIIYQDYYSPTKTSHSPKKNSLAEKLLHFIQAKKKVSALELRQNFPKSSVVIKKLWQKNIIEKKCERIDFAGEGFDYGYSLASNHPVFLNQEQTQVTQKCQKWIAKKKFQTCLLHGVTSSGKTEIYIYLAWLVLQQKKSVLVLIPEISMTPQNQKKFKEYFGELVCIWHSALTDSEKCNQWLKIRDKDFCLVLGTRSAIFSPLKNLKLLIVDEEQDTSFKQMDSPSYNARDCAIKLALENNALALLGSATPSLESYYNSKRGKYQLLHLKQRYKRVAMPKVKIVDLKTEANPYGIFYLSQTLLTALTENLKNKKQSVIFLNRRGFASVVICKDCQNKMQCPRCSVLLTCHRFIKKNKTAFVCHYCQYRLQKNLCCQKCSSQNLISSGVGTQKVEQTLHSLFPQANVLRLDSDSFSNPYELEEHFQKIHSQEIDIIVGTQIISKGHHFPNITLACVLLADMFLNLDNYRSAESAFQLIAQVVGRAGREENNTGKAIIQTYCPESAVLKFAAKQDYADFYEFEIEKRKLLSQVPFFKNTLIQVSATSEFLAKKSAEEVSRKLQSKIQEKSITILGPTEAVIYKLSNRFYWDILLQSKDGKLLRQKIKEVYFQNIAKSYSYRTRLIVDY